MPVTIRCVRLDPNEGVTLNVIVNQLTNRKNFC